MKAFCYHSPVPGLEDLDLLQIWEASWNSNGWEPVILTEQDARRADPPMFERYMRSPLLETRNPRLYTIAAMLRWVAMTAVKENCIHVDSDVMNNGLRPEDVIIHDPVPTFLAGSTCPCAIAASPRGWKLFAAWLEFAPFIPQFSAEALAADSCDQYAAQYIPQEMMFIQPGIPCKLYVEQKGWETAPMIHFPNRLVKPPRSRTVRKVLGL